MKDLPLPAIEVSSFMANFESKVRFQAILSFLQFINFLFGIFQCIIPIVSSLFDQGTLNPRFLYISSLPNLNLCRYQFSTGSNKVTPTAIRHSFSTTHVDNIPLTERICNASLNALYSLFPDTMRLRQWHEATA